MIVWSTFSGVGGLDLGLAMAGLPAPSLVCEWEPWNRALLAERYPNAIQHTNITTLEAHHGPRPDLICGGFPCQDISAAGAQTGLAGAKSGLWWELGRVIAATRPRFVVLENVAAILSDTQPVVPPRAEWLGDAPAEPLYGAFGAVLWTLAALGYDATWDCVPAGALGAPHRRDRWFLVAYSAGGGLQDGHHTQPVQPREPRLDPCGIWRRAINAARAEAPWTYLPRVGGASDGVPGGVDATWPTCRASEWKAGGWQRSGDAYFETLSGAVGSAKMPGPPKDRPRQPWEQGEPRTKPHQAHWKQRLRGLGNAVVPVAGMVPGLVVQELLGY